MASFARLSPADSGEAELWRRLKAEDNSSARHELFHQHAELAQSIARRTYRRRSQGDLDLADLVQQANSALLEAIGRYDPARGVPFQAYASRRIMESLADVIAKGSDVRAQYSARARAKRDRMASLVHTGAGAMTAGEAIDALTDLAVSLALGYMLEDGIPALAPSTGGTMGFNAYESAAWQELLGRLTEELKVLPERERAILSDHYMHGVAFETLALLFGLSKGRISQLHHAALLTLRKRLAQRGYFSLQR